MSEYRFHLQKYKYGSKLSCPNCGKKRCFVKYVDAEGEITFPDNVGKCDHENSCGYHYTPKEYFKDNPDILMNRITPAQDTNSFCYKPHYRKIISMEETTRLFRLYNIGTSVKWGGSAVFWQVDIEGHVRAGKIMCYNPENGHRVKEPQAYVSWAHSELKLPDFHLKQCLFGEHLLKGSSETPVMLVESEKTAVIMSHFIPDYIWLATGGKNGCFNREAMQVLEGRDVVLIPDLGAIEQWKEKSSLLSSICRKVTVSDVLERTASEEQRSQGLDIADFFLFSPTKRQILQQMIQRNPVLQTLIDELGLELIE